jgi:membrane associated rhomboid family serine protease
MSFLRRPFRYRYENITLFLIGINILVFLAQRLFARQYLSEYLAMIPLAVINGWVWQFVTYMFAHGGLTHLLFNMLALFIFGSQVERRIGSGEFLLYYLLTGILAGVFSFGVYWFTGAYTIHLIGASGAIFAVQLAYAAFFPDAVIFIWGILPMRAPIMVLVFTLLELFSSFFDTRSGIAHFTHLAGFAVGWIYFLVRFGINPWKALTGR